MSARLVMCVYAGLTMLAACSTSYYAQFPPLAADVQGTRVERPQFSIVVPRDFELRDMPGDGGHLNAFEQPPDNGEHRLYRTLVVAPVAAMSDDDPERMAERAYALLAKRHEGDSLVVRQTGRARLADRDCWFLQGRVAGPSDRAVRCSYTKHASLRLPAAASVADSEISAPDCVSHHSAAVSSISWPNVARVTAPTRAGSPISSVASSSL